jgi:hypothetical protein
VAISVAKALEEPLGGETATIRQLPAPSPRDEKVVGPIAAAADRVLITAEAQNDYRSLGWGETKRQVTRALRRGHFVDDADEESTTLDEQGRELIVLRFDRVLLILRREGDEILVLRIIEA